MHGVYSVAVSIMALPLKVLDFFGMWEIQMLLYLPLLFYASRTRNKVNTKNNINT